MKQIFLIIFAGLLIVSCTKIEINTTIRPHSVYWIGDQNKIGIEYKLGDVLIADEIYVPERISNEIKRNFDNLELKLRVFYNEEKNIKAYFTYFYKGVQLDTTEDPVSIDYLIEYYKTIPGFVIIRKGTKVFPEDENEKTIEDTETSNETKPEQTTTKSERNKKL